MKDTGYLRRVFPVSFWVRDVAINDIPILNQSCNSRKVLWRKRGSQKDSPDAFLHSPRETVVAITSWGNIGLTNESPMPTEGEVHSDGLRVGRWGAVRRVLVTVRLPVNGRPSLPTLFQSIADINACLSLSPVSQNSLRLTMYTQYLFWLKQKLNLPLRLYMHAICPQFLPPH